MVGIYRLYFYKKICDKKDFAFIPNIYKQSIFLSPRLKKLLPLSLNVEDFAAYFLPNDFITLYKNLEKPTFILYTPYKETILKIEGHRIGRKGCVLEISSIDKMKETHDYWHNRCQELESQITYFKYILNRIPIVICGRDQEGVIHYCNRYYAQHLDKTEAEVLKDQLSLITQPHAEYLTLHGQRRFFEIQHFTTQKTQVTIGIDKTDYDLLKREFSEYLDATHNIFQQLSTPIAVFNAEQTLTFFNKGYQMLFEFDTKFLISQPFIGEILDDLRQRQKIPEPANFMQYKNMHKSFFNNLLEPLEETLHLANGKILRSLVTPQPSGGVLYMYEDITHHLQLEKEHKSLNAAQKEILDHLHEGVAIFGSDYRLRFSNPMFQKMFQIETLPSHVDDVLKHVETKRLSCQMILELFEKRTYDSGYLSHEISWAYTPLPDGAHLLNFFFTIQKTA